ncbi:hypothetical protein [Pseudokineococcus sp. 1T1Z-3]|uniref:hypothetical protein n=1 Tax=Pseudokineococcus sp. 1T1Z-3 TaxID=3132745 RepID=UPI0030B25D0B
MERRPLILATSLWVGLNLLYLGLTLGATSAPGLSVLAGGLVAAATVVVAAPLLLRCPKPLTRSTATVLAGVVPVAALLVMPFLDGMARFGYSNWWVGATGPLLAGLVLRRRGGAAAAAVALAAVVLLLWAPPSLEGAALLEFWFSRSSHVAVWPLGALGVRLALERVQDRTLLLQRGEDAALARAERVRSLDEESTRVVAAAAPLLRRLAAGEVVDAELAAAARSAEATIRDELHGGRLLTPEVRAGVAALRRRGWRVHLSDRVSPLALESPGQQLAGSVVADLVEACLAAETPGELVLLRPGDPSTVLTARVDAPTSTLDVVAVAIGVLAEAPGTAGEVGPPRRALGWDTERAPDSLWLAVRTEPVESPPGGLRPLPADL